MRVLNEECFILRTFPIKESSLVVDVFTRNFGRYSLMAKGARRQKSEFRGSIRPFQLLLVGWSGRGEIPTMTSLKNKFNPSDVAGRQIYCSYYLNELIIHFVRQAIPYPELFDIYLETLEQLAVPDNEFATLRVFEKNLLKYQGYELNLSTEVDGKTPIDTDKLYLYDFEAGPVCVAQPNENSVSGSTLMAIASERFDSVEIRRESQLFLRRAIGYFSDSKSDRSREVFRQTIRADC